MFDSSEFDAQNINYVFRKKSVNKKIEKNSMISCLLKLKNTLKLIHVEDLENVETIRILYHFVFTSIIRVIWI